MGSGGGTGGTADPGDVGSVGTMLDAVLGTGRRVGGVFFRCGWEVDNILDKTWSSVSNSSLSKTFALCKFRNLKVQKLCFLPPNIVLGLKKMSQKITLGQKIFLVWKRIKVQKNLGLK